jgi:hypothetical protein
LRSRSSSSAIVSPYGKNGPARCQGPGLGPAIISLERPASGFACGDGSCLNRDKAESARNSSVCAPICGVAGGLE